MSFKSVILVVNDVIKSRKLYEEILGCKIEADFGIYNVGYEGGLALYKKSLFLELIHSEDIASRAHNLAVYFEFDDIYTLRDTVIKDNFELVHDIKEQPWGQKLFRFYDYDKHIIEVAENMNTVLKNMYEDGMSLLMISDKTGYNVEEVTSILQELKVID
jgi:catechol 2,3-dioxygenase-like lactoylglutathione lyase family enzyme